MTAKEALEKCKRIMGNSFDGLYPTDEIEEIVKPIKKALNDYEQLERDVQRYFKLVNCGDDTNVDEYLALKNKLSKAGN